MQVTENILEVNIVKLSSSLATFLFSIFISLRGLERNIIFVVAKLIIVLPVQHYMVR
jgi:hypothetical protein